MKTSNKYLPNRVTSKKVLFCLFIGTLLLLLCLMISNGYFLWDSDTKPNFRAFAKNLANSAGDSSSLWDWFFGGDSSPLQYLKDKVPVVKILVIVIGFMVFCYSIFQFIRSAIQRLTGKDLAPFNWDIKTDILSKLDLGKFMTPWITKLKSNVNQSKNLNVKDTVASAKKQAVGLAGNTYLFLIDKYAPNDHLRNSGILQLFSLNKQGLIRTDTTIVVIPDYALVRRMKMVSI